MISREKFESYEFVRQSGLTNMLVTWRVSELANEFGLEPISSEEVVEIIKNYSQYCEMYL